MSREEAVREMQAPSYSKEQVLQDKIYVSKKLGISIQELGDILLRPTKSYKDYPSNEQLFRLKDKVMSLLKGRPI